ncbi:hypothetical protein NOR_05451 [Metarhizium rileyi]|nr:hypothetical protein NOR_05451 [Metarhizium rileyi RCEF 4871]
MSRRFYIETLTSGKQQFVSIKRSRSHSQRHHHHHHHVEHDYYKVGVEEWNAVKERERCLEEANRAFAVEVSALKAGLAASKEEAHHFGHVVVPQLQHQIQVLSADNEALRKSLGNASENEGRHHQEVEKLTQALGRLEKEKKELGHENCSLMDKMKHLQRQIESGCGRRTSDLVREIDYWRNQCRYWKDKYEHIKRSHDDVCITLDIRTEKMRAYEEILKRRRLI